MDVLKEFKDRANDYINSLERHRNEMCPVCGMTAEGYRKLVEKVKELEEKAWKYDELNN